MIFHFSGTMIKAKILSLEQNALNAWNIIYFHNILSGQINLLFLKDLPNTHWTHTQGMCKAARATALSCTLGFCVAVAQGDTFRPMRSKIAEKIAPQFFANISQGKILEKSIFTIPLATRKWTLKPAKVETLRFEMNSDGLLCDSFSRSYSSSKSAIFHGIISNRLIPNTSISLFQAFSCTCVVFKYPTYCFFAQSAT